ncbi:hypothetical protein [Ramlibacter alkalitolerans]|uniref:Uncharacterized protein n=1 Tax=Ramlibacter alkalitolerans TaxID=2039631 RepID=A0ABS1JUB3_9BURK|nr:hypothetical protein [Ramlibacter alkalitolerans]MBL0427868.1 hypothetical protein [Ramlibacter alkalitolerans]
MDELTWLQEAFETGVGERIRQAGMYLKTTYREVDGPSRASGKCGELDIVVATGGECPAVYHRTLRQVRPDSEQVQSTEWWHPRAPRRAPDHPLNLFLAQVPLLNAEHKGRGEAYYSVIPGCITGNPACQQTLDGVTPDEAEGLKGRVVDEFFKFAGDPKWQRGAAQALTDSERAYLQLASVDFTKWSMSFCDVTDRRPHGKLRVTFKARSRKTPGLYAEIGNDGGILKLEASRGGDLARLAAANGASSNLGAALEFAAKH